MTSKELQALRKFFMLDVKEAASLIGKVSPRSWQYWEAGRSQVPDDVADFMNGLQGYRQALIEELECRANEYAPTPWNESGPRLALPFYNSLEDYQRDYPQKGLVSWRAYQSAAAELFANNLVNLT